MTNWKSVRFLKKLILKKVVTRISLHPAEAKTNDKRILTDAFQLVIAVVLRRTDELLSV